MSSSLEEWSSTSPELSLGLDASWWGVLGIFLLLLVFGWWVQRFAVRRQVAHDFLVRLTDPARRHDPVIGRDEEVDRLIHILCRRTKRNPLLLGDPGVGKTALIEGLAQRLLQSSIPEKLRGFEIYSLDVARLFGDTRYRGDLERRLADLLQTLERQDNVILFIDEMHTLVQTGRSEGGLSVLDILKPMMARPHSRVIGATTAAEYKEYFAGDEALERRLQPMLVREVSFAEAEQIVHGLKKTYEDYHGVTIDDAALKAAVAARDHFATRRLPDIALDLIDEAAAKVAIELEQRHRTSVGVLHAAGARVGSGGVVTEADIADVLDEWMAK